MAGWRFTPRIIQGRLIELTELGLRHTSLDPTASTPRLRRLCESSGWVVARPMVSGKLGDVGAIPFPSQWANKLVMPWPAPRSTKSGVRYGLEVVRVLLMPRARGGANRSRPPQRRYDGGHGSRCDYRGQGIRHCANSQLPPKRSSLPPGWLIGVRHRELVVLIDAYDEAPRTPAGVTSGDSNGEGVLTCRYVPKGDVGNCMKNLEGWLPFVLRQHVYEGRWVMPPGPDLD